MEIDINCQEHHGLDHCRDKGWHGYQRSVGMGVLAYNLHKIGAKLLKDKAEKTAAELRRCRPQPTP